LATNIFVHKMNFFDSFYKKDKDQKK